MDKSVEIIKGKMLMNWVMTMIDGLIHKTIHKIPSFVDKVDKIKVGFVEKTSEI